MTHHTTESDDLDRDLIVRYDERLAQSGDLVDSSATRSPAAQLLLSDHIESPNGSEPSSSNCTLSDQSQTRKTPSDRLRRILRCLDLLERDRRRIDRHTAATDGALEQVALGHVQQGEIGAGEHSFESHRTNVLFPDCIARFRIIRKLGSGGFGIVFLAEDPVLRRKVAVKIPRPEALLTPDLQRRFVQESQLAARLRHPGVVSIYEAGRDGTISFQVTEYCSGGTLAEFLRAPECDEAGAASTIDCERFDQNLHVPEAAPSFLPGSLGSATPRQIQQRQLPFDVAAELLIGIADGVQHAHEQGILHRDLKPANILLQPRSESLQDDGQGSAPKSLESLCRHYFARVSDFGLAILLDGQPQDDAGNSSSVGSRPAQTMIAGTPRYMAPEQMKPRGAADQENSRGQVNVDSTGGNSEPGTVNVPNSRNSNLNRRERLDDSCSDIGPATDVYGLGAILYEVLCGVPVFQ